MSDELLAMLVIPVLALIFLIGYMTGVVGAEPTPEQKEIIAKYERTLLCEEYVTKDFCKELYER